LAEKYKEKGQKKKRHGVQTLVFKTGRERQKKNKRRKEKAVRRGVREGNQTKKKVNRFSAGGKKSKNFEKATLWLRKKSKTQKASWGKKKKWAAVNLVGRAGRKKGVVTWVGIQEKREGITEKLENSHSGEGPTS